MPKPTKPEKPDRPHGKPDRPGKLDAKPHGKPEKPGGKPGGGGGGAQHHGQLMALTFAPDVLTLREKGRNVALPVSATVLVVIDRARAELADLKAGMNVFAVADASGSVVSIDARSEKDPDEEGGGGTETNGKAA